MHNKIFFYLFLSLSLGIAVFFTFASAGESTTNEEECASVGCFSEGRCFSFGDRMEKAYCAINGKVNTQKENSKECDNNYECASNSCISGLCTEKDVYTKIFSWFKQETPEIKGNQKDMSRYAAREVFLVSNKDWHDVLPFVPVTTWTGNEKDCTRGYGAPENVCVYPALIWHDDSENPRIFRINSEHVKLTNSPPPGFTGNIEDFIRDIDIAKRGIIDKISANIDETEIKPGETKSMILKLKNDGESELRFNPILKFPSSDIRLESMDSNFKIALANADYWIVNAQNNYLIIKPEELMEIKLEVTYKKQGENKGFDADSIIYFMQQYQKDNSERVTILGKTLPELDNLLVAQPTLGAGLKTGDIKRISAQDYLSYWKNYRDVIYVQDNYELALLASTYASLLNAPLVIQGSTLDKSETFSGKKVICVGNVAPIGSKCEEEYNIEGIKKSYFDRTKSNKFMLVNPSDLSISERTGFYYTDKSGKILNKYTKDSLAAPFLASAKHELLIFADSSNYLAVDKTVKENIGNYVALPSDTVFECKAGESCSEGFQEKTNYLEVYENTVAFDLPEDIISEEKFHLYFRGAIYGCKNSEMRLYNNGVLIGMSEKQPCSDNFLAFSSSSRHNNFFRFYNLKTVKKGNLELRYSGSFAPYERSYAAETEYNPINDPPYKELFNCASHSSCSPKGEAINMPFKAFISKGESSFELPITKDGSDAILKLSMRGEYHSSSRGNEKNIPAFEIYLGTKLIGSFDYISADSKTISVYLTSDMLKSSRKIRIVPKNLKEDYSGYTASLRLESVQKIPAFLTIVGSPKAIPLSFDPESTDKECNYGALNTRFETDGRIYGSTSHYGLINLPVGRIMGLTTSDTSAYIARDLFYDKIPKNKDALLVIAEDYQEEISEFCKAKAEKVSNLDEKNKIWSQCSSGRDEEALAFYAWNNILKSDVKKEFAKADLYAGDEVAIKKRKEIAQKYGKSFLNVYDDHGSPSGFVLMVDSVDFIFNKMTLQPGLTIGSACSTCAYRDNNDNSKLFCTQGLRRGTLAQQGAVDVSYWHKQFDTILRKAFIEGESIGVAFMDARNAEYLRLSFYGTCTKYSNGDPYYALLGDPTWRPRLW
jgi:putative cell wall-binding protein